MMTILDKMDMYFTFPAFFILGVFCILIGFDVIPSGIPRSDKKELQDARVNGLLMFKLLGLICIVAGVCLETINAVVIIFRK